MGPLRRSPDYRWLYAGQFSSAMARQMTVVAAPYQVFVLTGSSLAVGLLGLAQLAPLLAVSLVGGAVADAVDRRRLLLVMQGLLGVTALGLAVNAAVAAPRVWPVFALSALNAGFSGIDSPTRNAVIPALLERDDLPAAYALNQTLSTVAHAVGPMLGGLVIARASLTAAYGLEAAGFVIAAFNMMPIRSLPPVGGSRRVAMASILEGLRFLRSRRLLQACFVIDLNAMVFGMPRALFPALGTEVFGGDAATVGFLYAAPGTGAMVGAVTAGWVGAVRRQGRAVILAVVVWGAAIAMFGLTSWLPLALILLGVAGAADVVSAVFRNTILQLSVPDGLRGRLSAIHVAVVGGGPRLGDFEAGTVAAIASPRVSVVSGGLVCVIGTLVIARLMPELVRYVHPPQAAPEPAA
ncbi:MAG: MFS transporter [Nitriliruptorales bacterium]|nr:MFS transporter [Nitriliruptorales bacterium]